MNQLQIVLPIEEIQAYCEHQSIVRLSVFESVMKATYGAESDIDLLVEYLPEASITLFDMARQEIELSEMIGRKVDLRTQNELSKYFRQDVIKTAVPIYECG